MFTKLKFFFQLVFVMVLFVGIKKLSPDNCSQKKKLYAIIIALLLFSSIVVL